MSEAKLPIKAYNNSDFLNSREARTIRVVCEFEETLRRLRQQGVKETIMVFGSARTRTREQWDRDMKEHTELLNNPATSSEQRKKSEVIVDRLRKNEWLCGMMETTEELCRRLTEWAMTYESSKKVGGGYLATDAEMMAGGAPAHTHEEENEASEGEEDASMLSEDRSALEGKSVNAWAAADETTEDERATAASAKRKRKRKEFRQSLMICTGGGPGLMEAANRGASRVPGAKNIGMKITLPFEQKPNPYLTPELTFQFHYFFTRKYWMTFPCRALIVAPGGYGTMDELFELLALKNSGKIKIDVPIVLFGREYWDAVLDLDKAVEYGTMPKKYVDSMLISDDIDEVFNFITKRVVELRDQELFFHHDHST